jgi:5'-nucleotidase
VPGLRRNRYGPDVHILVTNDDGIDSPGIQVLARHLHEAGHHVLVVAPSTDWSGAGAALGAFRPDEQLEVARCEIAGAPAIEAWALAGTPAATVVAANLGAFGPPPEVVVSGINAGLNTGRSVLHSGTVGAALTGQNFGLSGLAVSTATAEVWQWDSAAAVAVEVLDILATAPPRSVLNLNVPALPRDQIGGVRWARLAPFGAVRAAVTGTPGQNLQFALEATGYDPPADTDQGLVQAGYASLTTLVGVVEAWPPEPETDERPGPVTERLVPGAPLHPVHRVPDGREHRSLRRPELGDRN